MSQGNHRLVVNLEPVLESRNAGAERGEWIDGGEFQLGGEGRPRFYEVGKMGIDDQAPKSDRKCLSNASRSFRSSRNKRPPANKMI
jgi:hypothetical protein